MVDAYRPDRLLEALKIRNEQSVELLAGGTDLMVHYKNWSGLNPKFSKPVLFLDNMAELKAVDLVGSEIRIGASCTLTQILAERCIPEILKEAVDAIAAPALKNRATLMGNVCNASPAGDSIPPLIVLNARICLSSAKGERELSIAEFITGPGQTVLQENEIATAILIPESDWHISYFRKVGTRKANALTKLSLTGLANVAGDMVDDIRIAFGAVGPTIVRSVELEDTMKGLPLAQLNVKKIVGQYAPLLRPIDDQSSTAQYRKTVSLNLLRYFLHHVAHVSHRSA